MGRVGERRAGDGGFTGVHSGQSSSGVMAIEELIAFVVGVRAEVEAALARLRAVDAETLPPDLREHFDKIQSGWEELRIGTEELYELVCRQAGWK